MCRLCPSNKTLLFSAQGRKVIRQLRRLNALALYPDDAGSIFFRNIILDEEMAVFIATAMRASNMRTLRHILLHRKILLLLTQNCFLGALNGTVPIVVGQPRDSQHQPHNLHQHNSCSKTERYYYNLRKEVYFKSLIETFFSSVKAQQVTPDTYAETDVRLHVKRPLLAFDLTANGMARKR